MVYPQKENGQDLEQDFVAKTIEKIYIFNFTNRNK